MLRNGVATQIAAIVVKHQQSALAIDNHPGIATMDESQMHRIFAAIVDFAELRGAAQNSEPQRTVPAQSCKGLPLVAKRDVFHNTLVTAQPLALRRRVAFNQEHSAITRPQTQDFPPIGNICGLPGSVFGQPQSHLLPAQPVVKPRPVRTHHELMASGQEEWCPKSVGRRPGHDAIAGRHFDIPND